MAARYRDYDPFAWIYNTHWGAEYHAQAYDILWGLVLRRLEPGAKLLDLCCGVGHLTATLMERGWNVIGLDGSEEMLRYARSRAPGCEFLLDDARTFTLPRKVDAILSTFDSLNHVMSAAELKRVFRRCHTALNNRGWLAFDLNREEAYRELWVSQSHLIEGDKVQITQGAFDEESKIARCDVCLFRLNGGAWSRSDFSLTQKCHDSQEIGAALHTSGFDQVSEFDAQTELGMQGDIGFGRSFFLARRK